MVGDILFLVGVCYSLLDADDGDGQLQWVGWMGRDAGSRGAMGVGGGLGRRPPPACVGGRTSPAVAGGHLGGYDVGSESGVLSGEESCYLFTGVTFVFYDASVGRARAAASGRDELG